MPHRRRRRMTPHVAAAVADAAALLRAADGMLIGAGAGMGVDSGLPDFRGDHGFWRAYPPLAAAGIRFVEIANPRSFDTDPALPRGFYGHRLALYPVWLERQHSAMSVVRISMMSGASNEERSGKATILMSGPPAFRIGRSAFSRG